MKVHKITVENLNALYGLHTIDLEAQLHDAPIYLIVGPTGAGKSTLLDAVSLALFGETPRLANRRRRDGDDDDPRHIMSRGTGECRAIVEFSRHATGGQSARVRYRATWYCHRAKKQADGAFQTVRRALERREEGTDTWTLVTDDPRQKVTGPAFEAALDGLEVRDFQRSMLLAQGEFTALLKATPEEKAGILERLTSTTRFAEIGKRCSVRRRLAAQRLEVLDGKLQAIGPLPASSRALVERERDTQLDQLREARVVLAVSSVHDRWIRDRQRLDDAVAQTDAALMRARQAAEEAQPALLRLAEDRRIQPAHAGLLALRSAEARSEQLAAEATRLGALLAADQQTQTQATATLQASAQRHIRAVKQQGVMQPRLTEARTLDLEARHAATALADARRRVRPYRLASQQLTERVERATADQRAAQAAYDQATRVLSELPGVEKLAAEISGLRAEVRQLGAQGEAVAQRRADAHATRERLDTVAANHHAIAQDVPALSQSLAEAEERAKTARERLGSDDATTLVSLSGALSTQTARLAHATAWRRLKTERAPLANALGTAARGEHQRTAQLSSLTGEIATLAIEVSEAQALADVLRATVEIISRRQHLHEDEACPLCGSEDHPSLRDPGLLETDRRLQTQHDKARTKLDAERSRLGAQKLTLQTLQVDHAREAAHAHELARRVAELDGEIETEVAALGGGPVLVEAETAALDALSAQGADLDALDEAATMARSKASKTLGGESPDVVAARLEAETDAAESALTGARAALEEATAVLENRRGQHEAVVRQHGQTTRETLAAERELDAILARLGLSARGELQALTLTDDQRETLTTLEETVNDALRVAADRVEQTKRAFAAHVGDRPPALAAEATVAHTEAALAAASQTHEQVSKIVGALEEKLRQDADKRTQHKATIAAQQKAVEENELWQRLHRLVGAREGQAFQQFAQVLNLHELVEHANVHLRGLAPRFTLVTARDRDGFARLDFAVRDRHHAGRYRPITTLSGGETFLVSLSLALGLADMRTSGMRIETLLLDEGFGSLDPQSLDLAVEALEQVQATQQIQIGIISHVAALRDRIAAQIVIEPIGNGRSRIRAAAVS